MTNNRSNPELQVRTAPIFSVMFIGAFVAFLNQTLINIALPQIMNHLQITADMADWLTTVFMLVNGIVIPITAFLIERFSTRQLYIASMGFFTAGTLICAISPGFTALLIGRIVQAAGAGILFPLITNVIFTVFPMEKRGGAMGMLGVALNFAPAIGPTLSGWIVQNYSWRVLFYIIFPIALINLVLSIFLVKNVSETGRPKLDSLGVILSTFGFGGVLYGFSIAGSKGWGSMEVVASFIVGGGGPGLFYLAAIYRQPSDTGFQDFPVSDVQPDYGDQRRGDDGDVFGNDPDPDLYAECPGIYPLAVRDHASARRHIDGGNVADYRQAV
jgi:EmrB/QacA subfamily drug resistance transporter